MGKCGDAVWGSMEAVDPVFQTEMLDMLEQCGRCGGNVKRGRCEGDAEGLEDIRGVGWVWVCLSL